MVKPAELVDVVELTPLTLVDRRTYNLLIAYAWDRIDEDVEHAIPKAVLRGTHESNDRLSDTIRRLMAAQVEVRIIRDGKRYLQQHPPAGDRGTGRRMRMKTATSITASRPTAGDHPASPTSSPACRPR